MVSIVIANVRSIAAESEDGRDRESEEGTEREREQVLPTNEAKFGKTIA